jgi:ATP phosphoribosyltransferase regulatory subunit
VEIGHADFYKGLLEECGFDTENEQELRKRIENKNYFGVEEILDNNNITGQLKEAFLKLPELFGSIDVIKSAKELTDNKKALQSIERLEKLYSILEDYGVSKYISFDLGMISNFNYYTGIIFKAYTYGSGDQIVAGGRYLVSLEKKLPQLVLLYIWIRFF